MENFTLEFEKPIVALKEKLEELQIFSKTNNIDMSAQIEVLQEDITKTSEKIFSSLTPWQRVQLARHPKRPYAMDYLERIGTDFVELKGDRRYGNDDAIIGGFTTLRDGTKAMLIAQQKGRDLKERSLRNFGMAHPEGYRKALRLMQLADKVGCPIITIIDTPGAYPGIASEERHVGEAIAVVIAESRYIAEDAVELVDVDYELLTEVSDCRTALENSERSVRSPIQSSPVIFKRLSKPCICLPVCDC